MEFKFRAWKIFFLNYGQGIWGKSNVCQCNSLISPIFALDVRGISDAHLCPTWPMQTNAHHSDRSAMDGGWEGRRGGHRSEAPAVHHTVASTHQTILAPCAVNNLTNSAPYFDATPQECACYGEHPPTNQGFTSTQNRCEGASHAPATLLRGKKQTFKTANDSQINMNVAV